MKLTDLRLTRSSGIYDTREELVRAVLHKAKVGKMSFKQISQEVGVSDTTVSRIVSGDMPAYKQAYAAVTELPSTKLNKFWRIPTIPVEPDEGEE